MSFFRILCTAFILGVLCVAGCDSAGDFAGEDPPIQQPGGDDSGGDDSGGDDSGGDDSGGDDSGGDDSGGDDSGGDDSGGDDSGGDDSTNDTDGDGVDDGEDNCPAIANAGQEDTDSDGQGNACDTDDDNDTLLDTEDNCVLVANPGQEDLDNDGAGDACDVDDDNDGLNDDQDNCPIVANPGQENADGDEQGDACDADDDNDGLNDDQDNCPLDANPGQEDTDGDGRGDVCDTVPDLRISLVSQLKLTGEGQIHADVWGMLNAPDGKRYALVGGLGSGNSVLYVVNATDPANPQLTSTLNVPGFDVKVWKQYVYTVTGSSDKNANNPEGRIIDLSAPSSPRIVGSFPSAHNIFIDPRGYMYLELPGLRIMDLNADPRNPRLVWDSNEPTGGHDATVVGNRLYDFHGTAGTNIYDISNRANPRLLGSITDPSIAFHHSGWPSSDGRYLFICDEGATGSTPDVTVWDIQQPDNPRRVAEISDDEATVHNLYIKDDVAYVSYYSAGFRIYDVSDPTRPRLLDEYDTDPSLHGPGLFGAWGVFPYARFGYIYVSDVANGLFIFELTE